MIRTVRSRFVALMVPFLAACDQVAEDAVVGMAQVDTLLSGQVRVVNEEAGLWTSETAWTLEEDLRLGQREGEGPELFSQVAFILTDDDDRIFILDYPSQEIRVFTAAGSFSHRFGQRGQGPGEFERAAGLDWGPEGTLWVWGRRYSVFDLSGKFVTSYLRRVRGVIYPWIGGFVPGGRYIDWGLDREVLGREQVGQFLISTTYSGRTTFFPIEFTPPDQLDTLPPLEFMAEVTGNGELKIGRKSLSVFQADDGHLWFAHSDEYTVYSRTLEGDTTLVFSRPSQRMPVPQGEVDSIMAASAQQGRPLKRDGFVEYRRLITRLLTDNAGHVYVLPQEDGVPEGTVVDVFESSGVYLGRMHLPEPVLTRGPPPHVTTSHFYAVVVDEFDVPFVVRYRIKKP